MSSSAASGTPKWPGDHAEKHRQAALLGWARKRGFTRDTVKRGRRKAIDRSSMSRDQLVSEHRSLLGMAVSARKRGDSEALRNAHRGIAAVEKEIKRREAPPSRGMELARQVRVSAQRTRPAAHPDYSPHAGNVARLTLMHELGMEQDAAKRAKIRRELRKLGVPSNEIPKEPRKPRAPRAERSAAVSQPKAARDRENTARYLSREPAAPVPDEVDFNLGRALHALEIVRGNGREGLKAQLERYSPAGVRAIAERSGVRPGKNKAETIRRIVLIYGPGGEGTERSAAVSQPKAQRSSRVPSERSIENQRRKIAELERRSDELNEAHTRSVQSGGNSDAFARNVFEGTGIRLELEERKRRLARDLRKRAEGGAS